MQEEHGHKPTEGDIWVGGEKVGECDVGLLRDRLVVMNQQPTLFNTSVGENGLAKAGDVPKGSSSSSVITDIRNERMSFGLLLGIVTGNPRVFGELPVPVPAGTGTGMGTGLPVGFSLELLNNYDKVFNNNINYEKHEPVGSVSRVVGWW